MTVAEWCVFGTLMLYLLTIASVKWIGFRRFDNAVRQTLSVPHSTLVPRERAYRKKVDANPNRRGPKRKVSPSSVSHDPAV